MTVEQIALEEFADEFTPGHLIDTAQRIVRCGCGWHSCRGWATRFDDEPGPLREWESEWWDMGPLRPDPELYATPVAV